MENSSVPAPGEDRETTSSAPSSASGDLLGSSADPATGGSSVRSPEEKEGRGSGAAGFLLNILRGAAIGVAFIIPGFSGGTVAALLGIYDRLVGAVADIFKSFKRSFLFLLPVAIGMALGIAALVLPIVWGLQTFPIPTVTLFVGLSLGGLPTVTDNLKGGKPRPVYFIVGVLACAAVASIAFLPIGQEVDLFHMDALGYLLLVLVGIAGACALVVPGISGSMLLLVFGYYEPIVEVVSKHLLLGLDVGTSVLVIACFAAGILVGFFAVSVLMKYLLRKFPRGMCAAILGLIVGSVPLVYVSVVRKYSALSGLYASPWYWIVAVLLLLLGAALSYTLYRFSKHRKQ